MGGRRGFKAGSPPPPPKKKQEAPFWMLLRYPWSIFTRLELEGNRKFGKYGVAAALFYTLIFLVAPQDMQNLNLLTRE